MSASSEVPMFALFFIGYIGPPILLIWGWLRWRIQPNLPTVSATVSFIGFFLATVSAVLSVAWVAYAQIHQFPYYDPLLLLTFRCGALVSLGSIMFAIAGLWRPSSLRWHAPASAVLMLFFWILAASGECLAVN